MFHSRFIDRISILRQLDSAAIVAAFAAICYAGYVLPLLRSRHGDISWFVVAGAAVDATKVPPGLAVRSDIAGYDGVAFYRFAVDPWTRTRSAYGITLDAPSYRQQRILYPLIVHWLSFGNPEWIPALLVIVNYVAIVILAAFSALLAQRLGGHALWGVLIVFYPGFLITISRDLCEIVACMFAAGAILFVHTRKPVLAALFLSLAILTRETAVILAFGLAAAYTIDRVRKRPQRIAPIAFLLPLGTFVAWQLTLASWWGILPFRSAAPLPTMPFVEYVKVLIANSSLRNRARLYFSEAVFCGASVILGLLAWRRRREPFIWRFAWAIYFALAATLPSDIWSEDIGYMRVMPDFFMLNATLIIPSARSFRWLAAAMTLTLWYYLAAHTIEFS